VGLVATCSILHGLHPNSTALHGVLISLMDLEPSLNLPRLQPHLSAISYHNQLYLHYYYQLLEKNFNEEALLEFLEFFRTYSKAADMEVEFIAEEFHRDYFKEWLETLRFPLAKADQL